MEFKSLEKWRVQKNLSITEKQLDLAIDRMIKRHPLENWIQKRIANNGEVNVYLKLEFVNWLNEVYFSKEYYLDAEIRFFEKQISRLEEELNISHKELDVKDMSPKELSIYFDKSINTVHKGIERMRKRAGIEPDWFKNGRIIVPKEGVIWLSKNYFRKAYLNEIELYKLELQKYKRKLYAKARG